MRRLLVIAAAVVVGAACVSAATYGRSFFARLVEDARHWGTWKKPVLPANDPEILRQRQKEWINQVSRDYGRIRDEIDRAKSQGLQTDFLEPKLNNAMGVAQRERYREALVLLSLVEVQIPRKQGKVVPVGETEEKARKQENQIRGVPVQRVRRSSHTKHKTQP